MFGSWRGVDNMRANSMTLRSLSVAPAIWFHFTLSLPFQTRSGRASVRIFCAPTRRHDGGENALASCDGVSIIWLLPVICALCPCATFSGTDNSCWWTGRRMVVEGLVDALHERKNKLLLGHGGTGYALGSVACLASPRCYLFCHSFPALLPSPSPCSHPTPLSVPSNQLVPARDLRCGVSLPSLYTRLLSPYLLPPALHASFSLLRHIS